MLKDEKLEELLKIHLDKDKKIDVYKAEIEKNTVNGITVFELSWSWWAFFTGWAFFLYRKMYLHALIFFVLSVFSFLIPFAHIIIMIVSGMTGFYFYTKKFNNDLIKASENSNSIDEAKVQLARLGGYHTWVMWVGIIYYLYLSSVIIGFLSILTVVFLNS